MNAFAYRLPGSVFIQWGIPSESILLRELPAEGFVFSPFGKEAEIRLIPTANADSGNNCNDSYDVDWAKMDIICEKNRLSCIYSCPTKATTRAEHSDNIKSILGSIGRGEVKKCILSRVERVDTELRPSEVFKYLCDRYPDAFIYLFSTPESGTWVGASPELLLEREGAKVHSWALAGTRPSGLQGEWDNKNKMEQAIVVDSIERILRGYAEDVTVEGPHTHSAGPVEHLLSIVKGNLKSNEDINLLKHLSPTPAIAGYPANPAMVLINRLENHNRGYYGGFSGPVHSNGDYKLYVNLRGMQYAATGNWLYAGGGIVEGSDPDIEWEETENKMKTMKHTLK